MTCVASYETISKSSPCCSFDGKAGRPPFRMLHGSRYDLDLVNDHIKETLKMGM
jgi:hypothetical protein